DCAGARRGGLSGHCAVQDAAQDADGGAPGVQDHADPAVLHAQGQVHAGLVRREAAADPRGVPGAGQRAPVLRGPDERAVRQGPLQAGAGADQHGAAPDRRGGQGLRAAAQVRRLAVPLQAAQARGAGAHGDDHEAPEGLAGLPRAGAPAPGAAAVDRPQHAHADCVRVPERRQVVVHEQGDARRRRRAAVRVHDKVAVCRAHGLQVPALAGHRHARHPRPPAGGAQHHRDAVDHGAGAPARRRHVLRRPVRAVRILAARPAEPVCVDQAAVRQQAHAAGGLQDRRVQARRPAARRARAGRAGHGARRHRRGAAQHVPGPGRHGDAQPGLREAAAAARRDEAARPAGVRRAQQAQRRAARGPRRRGAPGVHPRRRGHAPQVRRAGPRPPPAGARPRGGRRRRRRVQRGPEEALSDGRRPVEVRRHPRDHGRQERRRLCRPRHRGEAGRAGARGRAAGRPG
ncbi:hypothetical protein H4S01_006536, partial [Coemansia sp. RSA 2610]